MCTSTHKPSNNHPPPPGVWAVIDLYGQCAQVSIVHRPPTSSYPFSTLQPGEGHGSPHWSTYINHKPYKGSKVESAGSRQEVSSLSIYVPTISLPLQMCSSTL